MAIVLTNGTSYIRYTDTGATKKIADINLAYQFATVNEAIQGIKKAQGKTKGYYVFDTLTEKVLWRKMSNKELRQVKVDRLALTMVKRDGNGKIKRKTYSQDTRKLIYNNANGCCDLCGRKILFEDMTLDHIKPLSMGGADEVENLTCTCYGCNLFKGNILPDEFIKRISEIYLYQMEKRNRNRLTWKIIHRLLVKMV